MKTLLVILAIALGLTSASAQDSLFCDQFASMTHLEVLEQRAELGIWTGTSLRMSDTTVYQFIAPRAHPERIYALIFPLTDGDPYVTVVQTCQRADEYADVADIDPNADHLTEENLRRYYEGD